MTDKSVARRRFVTTASDAGQPIEHVLAGRCPELPAGFLNKLLRKGYVLVDGRPAEPRSRVGANQRVALMLPPDAFLVVPNPAVPFRVVYEDPYLVVVEKPAGVVSEPGIKHKTDSLLNGLIARYGHELDRLGSRCDFGMVHRLDRDASGLMVIARQKAVHGDLVEAFRTRLVDKRYTVLVAGMLDRDRGEIRLRLGRTRRGRRAVGRVGGEEGQEAVTAYSVARRYGVATLVEARPRSGRWHQIRLHFRAIGHPVVGDTEEGDEEVNRLFREAYGLRRMFLHASALVFRHPCTGRVMHFTSSLPTELEGVLVALARRSDGSPRTE